MGFPFSLLDFNLPVFPYGEGQVIQICSMKEKNKDFLENFVL